MSRRLWLVLGSSAAVFLLAAGVVMSLPFGGASEATWARGVTPVMSQAAGGAVPSQLEDFDESTAVEVVRDEYVVEERDTAGISRVSVSALPSSVLRDGVWIAATPELTPTGDGGFAALDAVLPTVLAGDAAADDLISVAQDEGAPLTISLDGAASSEPSVTGEGDVSSEVTYSAAVDGSDLVVTVTTVGVYQKVVLEEVPDVAPVYSWTLSAPGLSLVDGDSGGLSLVDSDGEEVFAVNAPVMWDSLAGGDMGDAASTPVEYTVETLSADQWRVMVLPSLEWLADPARVYPVFVDPDVSTSGTVHSYKSDAVSTSQTNIPRVGNNQQSSNCCDWRTMFRFPGYDGYFGNRLTDVAVVTDWTFGTTAVRNASFWTASKFAFDGNHIKHADFTIGSTGRAQSNELFTLFTNIMWNRDPYTYFMLVGEEADHIYARKDLNVTLTFTYVSPPTINNPSAPTPVSTASSTVNVYANDVVMAVTGTNYTPGTSQVFRYVFTSSNGGTPWTSDWVTGAAYRIPDTVLTPGKNYSYSIQTMDTGYAAPVVTRTDSNWRFRVQAPPTVVAGSVKVDSTALAATATAAYVSPNARPTLSATVTDPEGGSVWAVFTLRRDGIVVLDSLQGSKSTNLAAGGQYVSTVQLPYGFDPAGNYSVEVQGFDGVHASAAVSPAQPFKVALSGSYEEIPGLHDQETVVAP